jgi:hypothetical protein
MLELETLREGRPGCPSDLLLDRLVAGELAGVAAHHAQAHLEVCQGCERRVGLRRRGFAAFADVSFSEERLRAGIERRLAARTGRPSWWRRWTVPFELALVAAAALVVIRAEPAQTVRAKGGLGLHVHRMRGEASEEMASGDRFAPGDRLRFAVDLPARGLVTIAGVESGGRWYQAWPAGAGAAALPAGSGQLLSGAVSLDGSRGREALYLIHCREQPARPCTFGGPGAPALCPAGCTASTFVLEK